MILRRLYGVVRIAVAGLIAYAIRTQFQGAQDDPFTSSVMFWSAFTSQGNVLIALVLALGGIFLVCDIWARHWWDLVRGAMVTYAVTIFMVHRFLVDGTQRSSDGVSSYEPWASDVLQVWVPLFVLLDWMLDPPDSAITWRQALAWLLYPVAFCISSLIRGTMVDWYPYDFLDPGESGGWTGIVLNLAAIIVGILVIGVVVATVGNFRHRLAPGGR